MRRKDGALVGSYGRPGRETGEFHWVHVGKFDSRGNFYTGKSTPESACRNGCRRNSKTVDAKICPLLLRRRPNSRHQKTDAERLNLTSQSYRTGGVPEPRRPFGTFFLLRINRFRADCEDAA